MTTNSNINNRLYDEWTFATYETSKFSDAILFHMKMGVYFDNETFASIKKLFMNDLEKKGVSQ